MTVPNQALCRVRVMGMISQPRHNQRSGVLDMNFSGFLRAHVEIRIHALAQESSIEARHTNHADNQMLMNEHSIFSYYSRSIWIKVELRKFFDTIPSLATMPLLCYADVAQWLEFLPSKQVVVGSSPIVRSITNCKPPYRWFYFNCDGTLTCSSDSLWDSTQSSRPLHYKL